MPKKSERKRPNIQGYMVPIIREFEFMDTEDSDEPDLCTALTVKEHIDLTDLEFECVLCLRVDEIYKFPEPDTHLSIKRIK